ncbi:MAG: twin-arginine translocase TatA/TatE family subunit [Verrucomicrobiae bacterium]|nr:twin-arginine translocase TatA/TatE family subunit [Verrucomicrobiae bacterium]
MNVPLAVWDLGMGQIILILLVVLLLFGAKKLPELAKGLGQGIKEFKKATRDMQSEIHTAISEVEEHPSPPPVKPASSEEKTQTPTT